METISRSRYNGLVENETIRELNARIDALGAELIDRDEIIATLETQKDEAADRMMRERGRNIRLISSMAGFGNGPDHHITFDQLSGFNEKEIREYVDGCGFPILSETRIIVDVFNSSFGDTVNKFISEYFDFIGNKNDRDGMRIRVHQELNDMLWNGTAWYDEIERSYWHINYRPPVVRPNSIGMVSLSGVKHVRNGVTADNFPALFDRLRILSFVRQGGYY